MSKFKEIKEKFSTLNNLQKESFLKEVYDFSKDTRLFLETRFTNSNTGEEFLKSMKRETIDKVYKRPPGTPNGKTVNNIILKAKKSGVNIQTLLELEKLAYRGFIEFLNEYGGGPESFDKIADKHLEAYLILIRTEVKDVYEKNKIYQEVKDYLLAKDNMYTDSLDEIYQTVTGVPVNR